MAPRPRRDPSRRRFLAAGARFGLSALVAPALLAGCEGGRDEGPSCMYPQGLTAAQRSMRSALGYGERAGNPARRCDACALFTAPPAEGECGGCTLDIGPVNPAGTCNSFAPKT